MMISIPGFEIINSIYESSRSLVYRAHRIVNGEPVILKVLREEYPSPEEIRRYRREYETTMNLDVDGAIEPISIEKCGNRPVLIFKDFGGESLANLMESEAFILDEILGIAIGIINIIGDLHSANLIHRDIKPSNIILNLSNGQIKIIDFGSSAVLPRRAVEIQTKDRISGTLAYMSPEQTGRLNRRIDWRTDYYSFGVTLYQMLTGRLPFTAGDELEIVHLHIAQKPRSPRKLNAEIPVALSNIVMKLLAKNPEDRYQSAAGVNADLERCRDSLHASGRVEPFSLGGNDIADKFHIPQKLYGREHEVKTLLSAFDRVCRGKKQMMLVSGPAGIGKTSLVREIRQTVARKGGHFIYGRFDPFERDIPYSALIAAFRDLMDQVLIENEHSLNQWRERLLSALGPNGQVMIDLVPEVELIIGRQPEVAPLEPIAAQNRLRLAWQNVIRVFCRPEHPLVLFLDFLSGIDPTSLALLESMLTDEATDFLFLIGAYREDETDSGHILVKTRDKLQKKGTQFHQIHLAPLRVEHLSELIADTLHCSPGHAVPPARLLMEKTGGNPFFVGEFLSSLYNDGILRFDRSGQRWLWDMDRISAREISGNVVALMTDRIRKLTDGTRNILELASVIGYRFEMDLLKVVYERPLGGTALDALKEALEEGLVVPVIESGEAEAYKFTHDRIRQAAYSLIPEAERSGVHLQVGRLMMKNTPAERQEEILFDLVGQLNFGAHLIETEAENHELAALNLRAGRRAKSSAAWETALNYLTVGIECLGTDSWETHYELSLALHEEAAEAAYLNLDYDRMASLAKMVTQRARTLLDQVKVHSVTIQAFAARNQHTKAVGTALEIAGKLGVRYPAKPAKLHLLMALIRTKLALMGKRIEDLADLAELDKTRYSDLEAGVDLVNRAGASIYFTVPELMALFSITAPAIMLRTGVTDSSAVGLTIHGLIRCGAIGEIETGYRFGRAGLKLAERFPAVKPRVTYMFNTHLRWWKSHFRESVPPLMEEFQRNLDNGDFETAGFCAFSRCVFQFDAGFKLDELERTIAAQIEAVRPLGQELTLFLIKLMAQIVANLRGQAEDPCRLTGEFTDVQKILSENAESDNPIMLGAVYMPSAALCYTFGDYVQALAQSERAEKFMDAMVSTIMAVRFPYIDSLIRLALCTGSDRDAQKRHLRKVAANQKKLKKWARHAPMNFLHKYHLVEAERCRVSGRDTEAMDLYDRAIKGAGENEYINDQAQANELAARFYLNKGKTLVARAYIEKARYCFLLWGATGKIDHLDETYPELLRNADAATGGLPVQTESSTTTTSSEPRVSLDLSSVMKATGALSQEIVLDRLLEKLMAVVVENAGAEKGFLIFETEDRLTIEAEGAIRSDNTEIRQSIPIDESPDLSSAIVHYVARTHENVVLSDAASAGKFAADPWIRRNKPRSVLCTPLINKGKLSGILYLKNDLITGAFTPERLEILHTLCAQAAISLENAQLYDRLADYSRTLEQIIAALNVAQEVQQSLLPRRPPQNDRLEVAGRSLYCDETGGDYYDFIDLTGKGPFQTAVVVGDVSGHGISSALLMAGVRAYLHGRVTQSGSVAEIITDVNRLVTADTEETGQFMTLFFMVLESETDRISWVRAGHDPAFVYLPDTGDFKELGGRGLAIGVNGDYQYKDYTTSVQSGQIVILSTDGVWEAQNHQGEMFGKQRFKDVIRKNAGHGAGDICKAVFDAVARFRGETPQADDVTLVVMKFR